MAVDAVRNQPFTLQVTTDGVDVERFDFRQNGFLIASIPFDPLGVQLTLSKGVTPGAYQFTVEAVGPGGSAMSDPVPWIVGPGKPLAPKVVILPQ